MKVRGTSEYLGEGKFRFTCPQGHTQIENLGKGPKPKRLSESACAMMAKWWTKGVTYDCKGCDA